MGSGVAASSFISFRAAADILLLLAVLAFSPFARCNSPRQYAAASSLIQFRGHILIGVDARVQLDQPQLALKAAHSITHAPSSTLLKQDQRHECDAGI